MALIVSLKKMFFVCLMMGFLAVWAFFVLIFSYW